MIQQNLCYLPNINVLFVKFPASEIEEGDIFPKLISHLFLSILFYHTRCMENGFDSIDNHVSASNFQQIFLNHLLLFLFLSLKPVYELHFYC